MSGAKYYVWGGGRWRELDAASGAVAGWARRPRFVFARRGRLRVASRRRVLAALQAHAAGRPGALGLGPRLSALSHEHKPPKEMKLLPSAPSLYAPAPCEHHHCCMHFNRCNNNKELTTCSHFDIRAAPSRCEVGTQHEPNEHSQLAINLGSNVANNLSSNVANNLASNVANNLASKDASPPLRRRAPPLDSLLDKHSSAKRPRSATTDTDDSIPIKTKPNKTRRIEPRKRKTSVRNTKQVTEPQESEDSTEEGAACKELTISESDVSALRSFVARVREEALERFDADDSYKRMLFYAINPLVDVERCPRTERALRERQGLTYFAARLGLAPHARSPPPARSAPHARSARSAPHARSARPVRYREASSSTDADKENRRDTNDSDDTHSDHSESDTFQKPRAKKSDKRTSSRKTRVTTDTDDEREEFKINNDKKSNTKFRASVRNSDSDTLKTSRHDKRENNIKINNKSKRDNSGSDKKRDRERKGSENKNPYTGDRIRNIVKDKHEENTDSDGERETFRKTTEDRLNSLRRKTVTPTKPNSYDNRRENSANKPNNLVTKNRKSTLVESDSDDSDTFVKKPALRAKTNRDVTDDNTSENKRELNRRSSYRKHNNVSHKENVVKDKYKETTDSDDERDTLRKATEDRQNSLRKQTKTPTNDNKRDRNNQNNANKSNERERDSKSTLVIDDTSSDDSDTFVKKSVGGSSKSSRGDGRPGPLELQSVNGDNARLQPTVVIEPVTKAHKKRSALTETAQRASTSAGSTSLSPRHTKTHTISKRASGSKAKEYSNLEDHAIVAWVCGGGRARRVNGNLVWRELQEQYKRLTGVGRSWHSLRNRYLRYILPSLGALHLPPATAARLRAAAATGETKCKRVVVTARRNSIFDEEQAARGASARRPAPRGPPSPPPEPGSPRSPPSKSPRAPPSRPPPRVKSQDEALTDEVVSDTSKRRSLRHRVSSSAGPAPVTAGPAPVTAGPAPVTAGPAPGPPRTRRLFNSKLML